MHDYMWSNILGDHIHSSEDNGDEDAPSSGYKKVSRSTWNDEKLARHLAKYKEHTGRKPFMCPHTNCNKDYLREMNLMHHMTAHFIAGDPALPFPYPWSSPYLGMGDNVADVYWWAGFTAWAEDEDVVLPLP
ncbi:hypothetical protein M422DRAFT_248119 [Sphaerobolus stellatus SS14]|uniref:C2H2-type domain-containing protein n=1 Tax=Sphaerobolus stellatus (strain SS14) TaxID=990650 RepID=A0A0C9VJ22_SPHS4|nr:hypothetical protein M422DRAFT_248119 [Sphaerobolus stellatus SS14]